MVSCDMPAPCSSPATSHWPGLLSVRELPSWMRDNDYIETGYRPQLSSFRACVLSAFMYMHNETVNVWTHFVGFLLCLYLLLQLLPAAVLHSHVPFLPLAAPPPLDFPLLRARGLAAFASSSTTPSAAALEHLHAEHARALAPLLLAACICLFLSALYHATFVRGPRVAALLSKLDFCGIALLISGHILAGVRVAFYCHDPPVASESAVVTLWRALAKGLPPVRLYTALTWIAASFVVRAILSPSFGGGHARVARAITFISLTSVGIVPIIHAGVWHGWSHPEYLDMVLWLFLTAAVYLSSAVIYATRVPECCRPGKHDLWCGSHQIMHLLVVCGVFIHYFGIVRAMDYRMHIGCSLSPLAPAL